MHGLIVKPYNETNRLIRVNVRRSIRNHAYAYHMWQVRSEILNRKETIIYVNDFNLQEFFYAYADAQKIPVKLEVKSQNLTYQYRNIKPAAISYSGGSESILLDSMFCGVTCVMGYNFFPYKMRLREFQLGLLAIAENYSSFMVGICSEFSLNGPFEYSLDFVSLWNKHFKHTLQYPITYHKHEVYEHLYSMCEDGDKDFRRTNRKLIIATCEEKGAPCGKCWKCAEQYIFTDALRIQYPEWNIPEYPIDYVAFQKYKEENQRFYLSKTDPYNCMGMLNKLEEDWDYKNWRVPRKYHTNL